MKRKISQTSSLGEWLTRQQVVKLLLLFLGWRIILFLIGGMADVFLPYAPTFPYADVNLIPSELPRWLYSWANFDGVHYLTIANRGYLFANLTQAFFPLLPYIILHTLKMIFGKAMNTLLVGLVITNLLSYILNLVWFVFIKQRWGEKAAWIATAVLFLFPTSFFFGALYTESLFLLTVLLAFLFAEKKQWWWAAGMTILATSCRIVGIFLLPALFVEWWQQGNGEYVLKLFKNKLQSWQWSKIIQTFLPLLAIATGSLGLIGYMVFLAQQYHDPLYFLHVQSEFGAGREEGLILYPQVVWRSLKILLTARPIMAFRYLIYVQEFLAGTVGFLTLLCVAPKLRWSYTIYALGAFLLPTVTGTFSSMPRYILVCFPMMMLLTFFVQKWPKLGIVWMVLSTILLIINTMLFIQGYWVA